MKKPAFRYLFTRKPGSKPILVSHEDYALLADRTWYITRSGYAATKTWPEDNCLYMHRVVMLAMGCVGKQGDHINQDKLDNRRINLRPCTNAQNCANVRLQKNNTSGYKGVVFHKGAGKWMARIKLDYKDRYLGLYDTPEAAYDAYCAAAKMAFGEFFCPG